MRTTISNPVPRCEPVCDPAGTSLSNGEMECSNAHYLHSKCTASCAFKYKLRGSAEKICQMAGEDRAAWTMNSLEPQCDPICQPLTNLANGLINCDSESDFGSTCKFICNISRTKCFHSSTKKKNWPQIGESFWPNRSGNESREKRHFLKKNRNFFNDDEIRRFIVCPVWHSLSSRTKWNAQRVLLDRHKCIFSILFQGPVVKIVFAENIKKSAFKQNDFPQKCPVNR